ncbi:hypothetical protein PVAND_014624 [Polypedilum vanderplanki]|uniref:Uncharacterized protein n=1 Tax=Polypedilum vanderplanki TaxID=319348 RepID=A0A9J6BA99_POLVA|nr:hypothetical protein PVAND_014624 [Polypedilum vanderplanki]
MEEDIELAQLTNRNSKTPRSPLSTPSQKRIRSNSEEVSPNKNSLSNALTMDTIKILIFEMGKEISASIKAELNMNNEMMTTSLVNNIKTLHDTMNSNNKKLETEISAINTNISSLDTKFLALEVDLRDTKTKMESIENTTNSAISQVMKNQQHIDNKLQQMIKQSKLDNVIEISGIDRNEIQTSDPKELALKIFSSFSLPVENNDLSNVYKKEIEYTRKTGQTVKASKLCVTFAELDKKIAIMKQKRKIQDSRNIYFNTALTELNSYLLRHAKYLIKRKGLKAWYSDGAVRVKITNENNFPIYCEDDLIELKNQLETIQSNSAQNDQ